MKALGIAMISLWLAACATQAPRVQCEGRLQPINRPVEGPASTAESTTNEVEP